MFRITPICPNMAMATAGGSGGGGVSLEPVPMPSSPVGKVYTSGGVIESQTVCAKHGQFGRVVVEVSQHPSTTSPFCPYCYGEWMASQFPVTEVADGT